MIKITEHIRINALTVFMFASCFIFRYPPIFAVTYGVMLLHETAHAVAALCIGLKIDYIALQPFGASLRLGSKIIYYFADEVILYISGPLVNALAAVAAAVLYRRTGQDTLRLFYMTNLTLFIVNLLPAMPLDGGMLFKAALQRFVGVTRAVKVCTAVSFVIFTAVTAIGVYAVVTHRNISILMFASLILGNIFTQRGMCEADRIREAVRQNGINPFADNNITVP